MKNLIKKILKEEIKGDTHQRYIDGILKGLIENTFVDENEAVSTPWFPNSFKANVLSTKTHLLLIKVFQDYCMKKFGLTNDESEDLWHSYVVRAIFPKLRPPSSVNESEVYNIFEEDEFDPFGHITDQSEGETELEELGFDLDKDCVLGFSKKNAKLEWPYFSLPAGYTCPFATFCKNFPAKWEGPIKGGKWKKPASWDKNVKAGPQAEIMCYAARAQGQYPGANVQAFKNLDLLKKVKTKEKMANLIIKSMEYHGLANTDILRIHEAGDFFSQDYLDAWIEVAKKMPQTLFYAYTVSLPYYMARKGGLPKNFKIIASMDKHNEKFILDNGLRYSRVVGTEEEAKELGLPIDVDDSIAWGSDDNFALVILKH